MKFIVYGFMTYFLYMAGWNVFVGCKQKDSHRIDIALLYIACVAFNIALTCEMMSYNAR